MSELDTLFAQQSFDCRPWVGRGRIPKHYKRLSCTKEEAMRLAKLGWKEVAKYFGESLFFTQSVIAGAILSDKYDKITIVTTSTYGKSWLMGRIGVRMAHKGEPTYIVASNQDGTKMIMGHVVASLQTVAPEVKAELLNKKDQIERLATSVSKARLAFSNGGFVEPITTADTYEDNLGQNKAIGKPGNYIVDEAALVSDKSFAELGRADLARVDGHKYKLIMISNPHRTGVFYDSLTKEKLDKREIVIWMDALTAVEEERVTKEAVFGGEFAKHRSTLRRYLLCVLDEDGEGMFSPPKIYEKPYNGEDAQYFIGVDAAYKGKDNIEVAIAGLGGGRVWVEKCVRINKKTWIEGKTPRDIIKQIARIAREYSASLICVDVGWGVWLTMGLEEQRLPVLGINFASAPTKERVRARNYSATNAVNKRAEMHLDLQDLCESGVLEVSRDVMDKIADVLPHITSERRANGKIQIRPKAAIKAIIGRSPDAFDAVLLAIHALIMFYGGSSEPIV